VVNPSAVNSGSTIYNFNVSIPATATPGLCKMRVVMRRSGNIAPCATGFKGEVEDYNVTLTVSAFRMAYTGDDLSTEKPQGLVYPNPSNGEFTFEMPSQTELRSYTVTNLYGQTVLEKTSENTNSFTIDIRNLPSGLYILMVQDSEGNLQSHKLRKN